MGHRAVRRRYRGARLSSLRCPLQSERRRASKRAAGRVPSDDREREPRAATPAPPGMVWIPGGEFSMGAQDPPDVNDVVGMQATTDSRPVHRVFVDGFWMDATEVTNEQFAAFVEGDRLRHGRGADAARGGLSRRAAGESRRRLGRLRAADHAVPLNDHFAMVVVRDGRELAAPARPRAARSRARSDYPVVHVAYEDARGLREVGRASACRPRPSGSSRRAAA